MTLKWRELARTLDMMKTNWSTLRRTASNGWTFEHASSAGVLVARENSEGRFVVVEHFAERRDRWGDVVPASSRVRLDIDFYQARCMHILTHGKDPDVSMLQRMPGCLDVIEMEVLLHLIADVWKH